jgi:hypothetical protein
VLSVSRSSRRGGLAAAYAEDEVQAVLQVLRDADAGLTPEGVRAALRAGGVSEADVAAAWPRVQRKIRWRPDVEWTQGTYRWCAPAATEDLGAQLSRLRQAEIDAVRALAELAIEVEELAFNEASTRALVHRVRARAKLAQLEPIERAGAETTFNRLRHKPIGQDIADGTVVVVVRPGYVWKAPPEDLLIAKAVVQDRS